MRNFNTRLSDGERHRSTAYSGFLKILRKRPEDVAILSGVDKLHQKTFPEVMQLDTNRLDGWKFIAAVLWNRFEWHEDREVFRVPDHWISLRKQFMKPGKTRIVGDCEDLALTALEFALEAGIPAHRLYLLLCLGTGGQSLNRRRKSGEAARVLDHCIAGLMTDDMIMHFIDSSERNDMETNEECRLQFYIHHRMDWANDLWVETVRTEIDPPGD